MYIFNSSSLFFFMLGGFLVSYMRSFYEGQAKNKKQLFSLSIVVIFVLVKFFEIPILSNIMLLISPLALWFAFGVIQAINITWFMRQSFFIYAFHIIPVTVFMKILI